MMEASRHPIDNLANWAARNCQLDVTTVMLQSRILKVMVSDMEVLPEAVKQLKQYINTIRPAGVIVQIFTIWVEE